MVVPASGTFYDSSVPFVENYRRTRVSYSGCDMVATITVPQLAKQNLGSNVAQSNDVSPIFVIGELHTLSYSIHTQDMPVRSFGRKGIKAFTSGPRTIAGSLVFSTFDRHIFRNICKELVKHYSFEDGSVIAERILSDELPPFNITVTFANEYGSSSVLVIYGVHIQDEGQVMSLDDIMTETTMSYFALDIVPLEPLSRNGRLAKDLVSNQTSEEATANQAVMGDYYVHGSVKGPGGLILPSSILSTGRISLTDIDGTVHDRNLDSNGEFFVYTIGRPEAVSAIFGGETYGTSAGIGHEYSIVLDSIPVG